MLFLFLLPFFLVENPFVGFALPISDVSPSFVHPTIGVESVEKKSCRTFPIFKPLIGVLCREVLQHFTERWYMGSLFLLLRLITLWLFKSWNSAVIPTTFCIYGSRCFYFIFLFFPLWGFCNINSGFCNINSGFCNINY